MGLQAELPGPPLVPKGEKLPNLTRLTVATPSVSNNVAVVVRWEDGGAAEMAELEQRQQRQPAEDDEPAASAAGAGAAGFVSAGARAAGFVSARAGAAGFVSGRYLLTSPGRVCHSVQISTERAQRHIRS